MCNDLALSRVVVPVPSVEHPTTNGHEGVIEFRLKSTVPMRVYNPEGIRVSDGNMVGREANERAY